MMAPGLLVMVKVHRMRQAGRSAREWEARLRALRA